MPNRTVKHPSLGKNRYEKNIFLPGWIGLKESDVTSGLNFKFQNNIFVRGGDGHYITTLQRACGKAKLMVDNAKLVWPLY